MDVERRIENELKMVVESGRKPGAKLGSPLVFIDLIMGLCVANRTVLPKKVHETITGTINYIYVSKYCMGKKIRNTKQTSNPSGTTTFVALNYKDWDSRMRIAFSHTWGQNESNHSYFVSMKDSMYRL